MNHVSLSYQQLQSHKFLYNILKHVVFLKDLRYDKMVVHSLIFDALLMF